MSKETLSFVTPPPAEKLQNFFGVFLQFHIGVDSLLDGTLPENPSDAEGTFLPWTACPVLAGAELGEYSYHLMGETVTGSSDELVSGLYLARRGFWTEKTSPYPAGCEALWNELTKGAAG